MTEEIFKKLGFTKEEVSKKESGDFAYYFHSLKIGDIDLISNSDDEAEKKGWSCTILYSSTLAIKGEGDLEDLVRILKLNT